MTKKLIFAAIAAVIVVALLVFAHYAPVWVSVTNAVTFLAGVVVGWIIRYIYAKYFKNETQEGETNE